MRRIRHTLWADGAIERTLAWSLLHYGDEAASRYAALIRQAERDLADDPSRPGTRLLADGVIAYSLR